MNKRTFGERWVLYITRKASIWSAVFCILISVIFFYKYFSSTEDQGESMSAQISFNATKPAANTFSK